MQALTVSGILRGRRPSGALRRYADLVRITALRALKSRYRGSVLGVLWSFGNPILMTVVYTALFGTAFASYYANSVGRYVLSCFIGVVVVLFFVQSTSQALSQVVANGSLLNKIRIPPAIFPLGTVAANVFQALFTTLPVMLVLTAIATRDPVRVVLIPVAFAGLIAITTGMGLVVAALYVFFRDLPYLWEIATFVLWITTPIFYPADLVPAGIRAYLALNPMAPVIASFRDLALGRGPIRIDALLSVLAIALFFSLLGTFVFVATRDDFMDLL